MPTQKKLKDFFEARRREMTVADWKPLKTAGGELRLKLLLKMPILNHSLQGVPTEIAEAFKGLAADDSPIDSSKLNIMYDGMTVEFFSNEEAKTPWTNGKDGLAGGVASVTGALFDKFELKAAGKGDKRKVDLQFICYVNATPGMKDWAFESIHGTVYCEATYSQSEMSEEFMKEAEPNSENDAQEEESEQLTLVPAGSDEKEVW